MTDVEQTADARKEPKVIKRYTNRKLYDTVESRYVTLDEISEMIKAGSEVRIVDNRSKEDLTSVTLAQIIFEEEKKRSKMPLGMLRDIIRHSGETLSGFLQTQVGQAGQKLASIKEEAEVLRDRILRREESARAAAAAAGVVDPTADPSAVPQGKPNAIDQAKEMVAQSQRAVEDWQKRLDERVRQAVENVTSLAALAKDLATLEKRIAELEKRLDDAEKK
ncbi:MAG TPA: polyhydroxyalkanoate synthesis regulator DNA-binding domain-containing protein [Myxococcales bacterium]|jgi:polyhydroxyalkanoate synthesis repressor PhaR